MEVRTVEGTAARGWEGRRWALPSLGGKREKIAVVDLSMDFGSLRVLEGITLGVGHGEFVALVGPSGCGKSTLLRILAGLVRPSGGRVQIDGTVVSGPSPSRNLVFQEHALYPWRTVTQNVALGLEILGLPRVDIRDRVRQLLVLVGLAGFEDFYPHQISGGMRQRAALARVLAVDPEVLLLDEPFGALDAMTRLILQDELLRLWNHSGKTVVLVTHDVDEALYLADRVALLSAVPGRVREIIRVEEPRPRDRGSASLVRLRRTILDLLGLESAFSRTGLPAGAAGVWPQPGWLQASGKGGGHDTGVRAS